MKISAIIDGNVVSGTVLLDNLDPLTIKLKHKHNDAGVIKYLIMATVNCQPKKEIFDYSFLNPYYYTDLFVDVNGTMHPVAEPAGEDEDSYEEFEVQNPINDQIYTSNQIPEVDNILIVEEVITSNIQEYVALSHFAAPNLVEMEDLSVNEHFVFDDERKLRFDVTATTKTVKTDIFDLNHSPEVTIAIDGTEPSRCRLILINHRGEEMTLNLTGTGKYEMLGRHCFSVPVISSTKDARIEVDYDTSITGIKQVYISDLYVGKTAQYFEADDMDVREIVEDTIKIHPITCIIFEYDRLPSFGLRNLLDVRDADSNGIKIQFSNSKVRVSKMIADAPAQVIMSNVVPNDKYIGVVITDVELKIYSDGNEIKTVPFTSPLAMGEYTTEFGASETEPDQDSNTEIKVIVSNKNSFE